MAAKKLVRLIPSHLEALEDCALYWSDGKIPKEDFKELLCNLLLEEEAPSDDRAQLQESLSVDFQQSGAEQDDGTVLMEIFIMALRQVEGAGSEGRVWQLQVLPESNNTSSAALMVAQPATAKPGVTPDQESHTGPTLHSSSLQLLQQAVIVHPAQAGDATLLANLGHVYGSLGNHHNERDMLERCLAIEEAHYGGDHVEVAKTLNDLGNAYGSLGDHEKKRDMLERSLAIKEAYYGSDHLEVAKTLNNLGNAHGALGDHEKRRDMLERCLAIKEAHYGENHSEVAKTLSNLGKAYALLGHHHKKREMLERCLAIFKTKKRCQLDTQEPWPKRMASSVIREESRAT